jgi:hypothetical protein
MRWLLLDPHPCIRTRTGNGHSSATGQEHLRACLASEADAAGGESVSGGVERCLTNHFRTPLCAICGEERSANQPRFLIAENNWEDKLTILRWSEPMASRAGIKVACSIDHVEELVIHWMTTGRLDYPFARTSLGAAGWREISAPGGRVDISGARPVGELAVHRESLERVLTENPQSLQGILDALLDALRQEIAIEAKPVSLREAERKEEEKELCVASTEPEF